MAERCPLSTSLSEYLTSSQMHGPLCFFEFRMQPLPAVMCSGVKLETWKIPVAIKITLSLAIRSFIIIIFIIFLVPYFNPVFVKILPSLVHIVWLSVRYVQIQLKFNLFLLVLTMVTWSTELNQHQSNISLKHLAFACVSSFVGWTLFSGMMVHETLEEPGKRPVERETLIIISASTAFIFIWKFPCWQWNIGNEDGWRQRALYRWLQLVYVQYVFICEHWTTGRAAAARKTGKKICPLCVRSIPSVTLASVHLIRADPLKWTQFSFHLFPPTRRYQLI